MKIQTWKKPLILIAIVIVAAAVWAMYTFGNASAYFEPRFQTADHFTLNVQDNTNINTSNNGMYSTIDFSYDEVTLTAKSNVLYLSSSASGDPNPDWPYFSVTCNDSNYKFSHFTAVHSRAEDNKLAQSDNLEQTPMSMSKNSWNQVEGGNYNYDNYYACFSNRINASTFGFGTVTPEFDYFYMYLPGYRSTSQPAPGYNYTYFAHNPKYLKATYNLIASDAKPDGTYTLTFQNPDYAGVLEEGEIVFTAEPQKGVTFDHWEYKLTSNTSSSSSITGDIYPSTSVEFTEEHLMDIKAVFTGTVAPDSVVTPPTAIDGLKYTGSAQTLINAGTTSGGTMMYALGTDNSTAPASGWATELPTGVNVGNYYIWYKVQGNESTNDLPPTFGCVANIAEQEAPIIVPDVTPVSQDEDWDIPSFSSKLPSAHSAPKTEDYLMFSLCLLGLLFTASMITVASLKLRNKRK